MKILILNRSQAEFVYPIVPYIHISITDPNNTWISFPKNKNRLDKLNPNIYYKDYLLMDNILTLVFYTP